MRAAHVLCAEDAMHALQPVEPVVSIEDNAGPLTLRSNTQQTATPRGEGSGAAVQPIELPPTSDMPESISATASDAPPDPPSICDLLQRRVPTDTDRHDAADAENNYDSDNSGCASDDEDDAPTLEVNSEAGLNTETLLPDPELESYKELLSDTEEPPSPARRAEPLMRSAERACSPRIRDPKDR